MRYMLLLALFVSGCATQAKLKEHLDAYVGKPATEVVGHYGAPHKTMQLNSDTLMSYHFETGTTVQDGGFSGLVAKTHYCDLTFTVDPMSVVKTWTAYGDACRSR